MQYIQLRENTSAVIITRVLVPLVICMGGGVLLVGVLPYETYLLAGTVVGMSGVIIWLLFASHPVRVAVRPHEHTIIIRTRLCKKRVSFRKLITHQFTFTKFGVYHTFVFQTRRGKKKIAGYFTTN